MGDFAVESGGERYARAIMRRAGVPDAVSDGVVRERGAFEGIAGPEPGQRHARRRAPRSRGPRRHQVDAPKA